MLRLIITSHNDVNECGSQNKYLTPLSLVADSIMLIRDKKSYQISFDGLLIRCYLQHTDLILLYMSHGIVKINDESE